MRIITISRQFGSGGRELGKKLSALLEWDYYDKNIIEKLCEEENMNEKYVRRVFHDSEWASLSQQNNNGSFAQLGVNSGWQLSLLGRQRKIIEDIPSFGRDCVIVGRDADVILQDYRPLRIFACADIDFRLQRCMRREEKNEGRKLTGKQILKNIKKIDRSRIQTREILTGRSSSDPSVFDLTVNTSGWDMDRLAGSLAAFAEEWFSQCRTTEI